MYFLVSHKGLYYAFFFLIYINDLPLHFDHCSSDLYADDVTVHTHDSNIKILYIA